MVDGCYDHLLPEIRDLLTLSEFERIDYLQKDNWIGYPRAAEAYLKLHDLVKHPVRQRMPNLLIIGPTNNGKTMIIEKFCRFHKAKIGRRKIGIDRFYDLGEEDFLEEMPALSVQMPPSPDTRRFYLTVLEQLKMHCAYS
jgi:hypothetical protein